jgi:hypothetical protein
MGAAVTVNIHIPLAWLMFSLFLFNGRYWREGNKYMKGKKEMGREVTVGLTDERNRKGIIFVKMFVGKF